MAYLSLFRKYRSQTFEDVVGQDHVVRTIQNAIKAGRIAQGYLFCGSRGTGKTTVARLIAKALNCVDGPTPVPCNKCEACTSITEGSAVDVVEMDAASNRSVDDVDALRDGVKYPPMALRYKVCIIDEAHQLSSQAKDAFLKTLEEPPPHAIFILATTEAHKIPITIRSRCQQFDFRRGALEDISARLRYVTEQEQAQIDDDAVELIARSANGSYRDSLSLLEQITAYTEGSISAADVYTVLGLIEEDVLMEIGDAVASKDAAAALELADRIVREGRDVREVLRSAAGYFRDLLAMRLGADVQQAQKDKLRGQADAFTQERLVRIIEELAEAERDLRWSDQHRLGLELALLKAMAASVPRPESASLSDAPSTRVPTARTVPQTGPMIHDEPVTTPTPPVPTDTKTPETVQMASSAKPGPADTEQDPEAAAPQPREEGPISLAGLTRDWDKILRHLHRVLRETSLAALAREGRPVQLSDNVLTVGFGSRHAFHQKGVQQRAELLSRAINEVTGAALRIVTEIRQDAPPREQAPESPAQAAEPVQHPLINDVLTTFGGTLAEDSDEQYPWKE